MEAAPKGAFASLLQLPIGGAIYRRVASGDQQRAAIIVSAAITFFFAWRMSASVALYSIAWSGVNAAEAFFVRRTART